MSPFRLQLKCFDTSLGGIRCLLIQDSVSTRNFGSGPSSLVAFFDDKSATSAQYN